MKMAKIRTGFRRSARRCEERATLGCETESRWASKKEASRKDSGSVLIIVLWVALGLITIALYFANSMIFELRSSDNRVAAMEAEQAVTGAARYVSYMLGNLAQPGIVPDPTGYLSDTVPLGDSYFWLLGRSTNGQVSLDLPFYGLVDEASKLNLNTATLAMLEALPRMTPQLAAAIIDWRDNDQNVSENGAETETYMLRRPPYRAKDNRFESIEELRLVQGADLDILFGEDSNMNGVLDPNENDGDETPPSDNRDGRLDPGILEYLTVYSRDSKIGENGTNKVNVADNNARQQIRSLLEQQLGTDRGDEVSRALNPPGGNQPAVGSLIEFYLRSAMTSDEFAKVEPEIMVGATAKEGLVNVNTASDVVLGCLPGLSNYVSAVVSYRQSSSADKLQTVAWLTEVLDRQSALQAGPYVTTHTYQFTADICAVGHHGRGFQRSKFVFDTSGGNPQIVFRQDLTRLGWPLGQTNRVLLAAQREFR
jgi:type II secretory pathway component PulK